MSIPQNPLSKFTTYQMHHILAAFKYTEDAEATKLTKNSGEIGDSVGGSGIILVNEFLNDRFTIPSIIWSWRKYGNIGQTTTSMEGILKVADRTGGQFVDWFITNVLDVHGISTQYMTFALTTYFMGTDKSNNDEYITVPCPPLLFNVHAFQDEMNIRPSGTTITLPFTVLYNTTGQLPNISKPFQITLTHKDGQLNNTAPEIFNGGSGIKFRGEEDIKFEGRTQRLNKSKPMLNLKDVFEALEVELNQQTQTNKRQVQTWLSNIRNDYIMKINPPPKQERGDELPVKFKVILDPLYNEYLVDNRNLPFEQIDEDSKLPGISSITFKMGQNIIDIVEQIMKLSIQVGEDAIPGVNSKTFKTNISYSYQKDNKLHINIKIKCITQPFTSNIFGNTGPGEGAIQPLYYTFKSGELDDTDIIFFKSDLDTDTGAIPIEGGDKFAVYGDRELITVERIPTTATGTDFFKSKFSGLRAPISPMSINGLEDAKSAANINIAHLLRNNQQSEHVMQIFGNSALMSDFYRTPSQASDLENSGTAQYYKIPESYPAYLKVRIYLKPDAVIGLTRYTDLPVVYYYDNYYEISELVNDMTSGSFFQTIRLKKTDNII